MLLAGEWRVCRLIRHVRMAYLAVVASHTVNGVAAIHSDIIRETIFKVPFPNHSSMSNAF